MGKPTAEQARPRGTADMVRPRWSRFTSEDIVTNYSQVTNMKEMTKEITEVSFSMQEDDFKLLSMKWRFHMSDQ